MNDFALAVETKKQVGQPIAGRSIRVLRGYKQVMAQAEMLRALARRTGQDAAMHWLEYNLKLPTALKKIPTLVVMGAESCGAAGATAAENVFGAVLLFEYAIAGHGLRVFATDDTTGNRSVIAPEHLRTEVAREASVELLHAGALAVLVTCEASDREGASVGLWPANRAPVRLGLRRRSVPRYLPLCETYGETLALLGRHTRRNLRYYRRRLESEIGVEFVPTAKLTLREFLAMNRASINPVPDAVARWRYEAMKETAGRMLAGMRTTKGRWLSVVGGRRHGGLTEIDWQMNLAGLPRYSLSTVMRAYVLEHEVAEGTRRLAFTGGTPHSMRHSFVRVNTVDVVALRQSAAGWLLHRIAAWGFPAKNFLRNALLDEGLEWRTG